MELLKGEEQQPNASNDLLLICLYKIKACRSTKSWLIFIHDQQLLLKKVFHVIWNPSPYKEQIILNIRKIVYENSSKNKQKAFGSQSHPHRRRHKKGFVEQFLAFLDTFTLYLLVFLHPFNHNLLLFFNFLLVLASSL